MMFIKQETLFPIEATSVVPELESIYVYHITHIDNLIPIFMDGFLRSDAWLRASAKASGVSIAYDHIKERRLTNLIPGYQNLHVGECVPFYFCPRSVMLYRIHKGKGEGFAYNGGQEPVVHLRFGLPTLKRWADENALRIAFTRTNAGSSFFEAWNDLADLKELNWAAMQADQWQGCRDEKQAEFLVESRVAVRMVSSIGVMNPEMQLKVNAALRSIGVEGVNVNVREGWYY